MTCCVIRGEPSAVPVQWVGAVLAERAGDNGSSAIPQTLKHLRPQVPVLIISTDGGSAPMNRYGVPVAFAKHAGSAGMLLAALEWTAEHAWGTPWVATVPAKGAPLPPDLVVRLATAVGRCGADMACIAVGGRIAWQFGLWPVRLRRDLRRIIAERGESSLANWTRGFAVAVIDPPTALPLAPHA